MKSIHTLEDATIAIRELYDRLDKLEVKDIDMKKRRVVNASPSVDPYDYVVRKELQDFQPTTVTQTTSQSSVVITDYDLAIFNIAVDSTLIVRDDVCPYHIVGIPQGSSADIIVAYAQAKNPSVGAAIKLRVWKNFNEPTKTQLFIIEIPADSDNVVKLTSFDSTQLSESDYLSVDVIQIGSTSPGGTVVLKIKYRRN